MRQAGRSIRVGDGVADRVLLDRAEHLAEGRQHPARVELEGSEEKWQLSPGVPFSAPSLCAMATAARPRYRGRSGGQSPRSAGDG